MLCFDVISQKPVLWNESEEGSGFIWEGMESGSETSTGIGSYN